METDVLMEQEIGALPDGWEWKKLGEIGKYINGTAFKPNQWAGEGLPIIRIQNLNTPTSQFNYCNFNVASKFYVKHGDLLFAWSGTPGTSFGAHIWYGGDAILNQHIFRVEFDEKQIDKRFFQLALNYTVEHFIGESHGSSGLAHIKKGEFENSQIPLPPLPEQQRIVQKLDALFARIDEAIGLTERGLSSIQKLLPAAMNRIFNNENDSRWNWIKLGEAVTRFEYGSAAKSKEVGRIPVMRMGNIQNNRFDYDDLVYTDDEAEITKYLLKENDVLFNRTNSPALVGKTAIYKAEKPAIFAGYLIRIHYRKGRLNGDYLNYFLNSPFAKQYGDSVKGDAINQSNISASKLREYPIPIPSLSTQQSIVEHLNTLSAQKSALEAAFTQKLSQLKSLKRSLLDAAFKGEL